MATNGLLFTLNEELSIPKVIKGLHDSGIRKIIVVDGHSQDKTVPIAKKMGARVLFQEGKGKGSAFQTFLKKYKIKESDYYVMLDADMTYDPKDINIFIEKLQNFEVVSGVRHLKAHSSYNLTHYIGNKIISLVGLLAGWGWNPDICTGYWGFRGSSLKKIKITANFFDLEADIFTEVIRRKLKYGRIKIWYYDRVGDRKLKKSDSFLIMKKLIEKKINPQ